MSFYLGGCRIRVSFYFFALVCAGAFFDRSGITLLGLAAAFLHEAGHLAAMLTLPGEFPGEISVTPFGIRIRGDSLSRSDWASPLVLAAGSGVNLLSVAVTFGFLPEFAAVSFVIGAINLLPVEGTDGGGLVAYAAEKRLPADVSVRVTGIISFVTLCAMALAGIIVLVATGYNFTLLGAAAALGTGEIKRLICRKR